MPTFLLREECSVEDLLRRVDALDLPDGGVLLYHPEPPAFVIDRFNGPEDFRFARDCGREIRKFFPKAVLLQFTT